MIDVAAQMPPSRVLQHLAFALVCCAALLGCSAELRGSAEAQATKAPPPPKPPASAREDASADRSKAPASGNVDAGTASQGAIEPLGFDAVLNLLLDRKLTKLQPERLLPKLAALAPVLVETQKTDRVWVFKQELPQKTVEIVYWKTKRSWFLEAIDVTNKAEKAAELGDQIAALMQQRAAQGKKCSPTWCLDITIHGEKGEVPLLQLLAGMPEVD